MSTAEPMAAVVPPPPPPPPPAATPPAPAPAAATGRAGMLPLPERGDRPARLYMLMGIAFYVLMAVAFAFSLTSGRDDTGDALREMIGLGERTNPVMTVLILGGIGLTALALIMVLRDVRKLQHEEDDVAWVERHGAPGLMYVFAPPAERESRFRAGRAGETTAAITHVETLVDDRVRRKVMASLEGSAAHVPVEELRVIAETRTLAYGQVARFAASMLLLLAVLGTFAGVKTALPSLIDAVSATGGASGADGRGVTSIVDPLQAVADAFGGNALALIGAIAVGLMAQGLAIGRRNLLERLELVSAEHIYDRRRATSADPLVNAVNALNETAEGVREAGASILGLESGLAALREAFQGSLDSLNDRLADVLDQQDRVLHERTGRALDELQARVTTLTGAVEANALQYNAIIEQVGARAAESKEALRQMAGSQQVLSQAVQGMVRLGDGSQLAAERLERGLAGLTAGEAKLAERIDAVGQAFDRVRPGLEAVEEALVGTAERIAGVDARAAAAWADAGAELRRRFAEVAAAQTEALAQIQAAARDLASASARAGASHGTPALRGEGGGDVSPAPDMLPLLRRIAAAVETPRGPTPRELALSAGAAVVGSAAVLWAAARLLVWLGW